MAAGALVEVQDHGAAAEVGQVDGSAAVVGEREIRRGAGRGVPAGARGVHHRGDEGDDRGQGDAPQQQAAALPLSGGGAGRGGGLGTAGLGGPGGHGGRPQAVVEWS